MAEPAEKPRTKASESLFGDRRKGTPRKEAEPADNVEKDTHEGPSRGPVEAAHGGDMHDRHRQQWEALNKTHRDQHRDLHGSHRLQRDDLHKQHQDQRQMLAQQQMQEMQQAGATADGAAPAAAPAPAVAA